MWSRVCSILASMSVGKMKMCVYKLFVVDCWVRWRMEEERKKIVQSKVEWCTSLYYIMVGNNVKCILNEKTPFWVALKTIYMKTEKETKKKCFLKRE